MYKRVLSEAPSTPSKRANQARFVISPVKQTYQNNSTTYVREIRDPIDHSLIAVTFEGVYDLRSFFNGYDTVKDDENNDVKSHVSGMVVNLYIIKLIEIPQGLWSTRRWCIEFFWKKWG